MSVFAHPEFDHHEQVDFFQDRKSGLKAIVAIHNTNLGPALGGCRMWPYQSDDEALTDVLRLSKGMTYKSALAGLPLGGGKCVIIGDPRKDKSDALLHALGRYIEGLCGAYITAEDSGTSVEDMVTIGEQTQYVSGVVEGSPHGGDPSPSTAYGTFIGLKAAAQHQLGSANLEGVTVAIQGVGHVGYYLAEYLHEAGAKLVVCDIFPEQVDRVVTEFGATAVGVDDIYSVDAEIFAPCAMGASINPDTIPQLKAKVIAGAANNQLSNAGLADQLMNQSILYTPDYVINAGGIIDIAYQRSGEGEVKMRQHIERIGETLLEIFRRSESESVPTTQIADRVAEERFMRDQSS